MMNIEINHFFLKVLTNSLDTPQTNLLGEKLNPNFNVYRESGFYSKMPLPRKTAADVLLKYFKTDEEIVELFTIMLRNEGTRFYNSILNIWGKEEFIKILSKHKWIFDPDLTRFFIDPFYEHEINFLKDIRIIDLRPQDAPIKNIIKGIEKICSKMSVQDLEWRITLRLYDLEPQIGDLIRKILDMLLARQNLQVFTNEMYVCLKELAINASKANYKLLFERYVTKRQGVSTEKDYYHFIRLFKAEIEEHGNKRLLELAREKDRFINITFQSTRESIAIWVTNNENISVIEKNEILKKIGKGEFKFELPADDDSDISEGAGFGLNLILGILRAFSTDPDPLKIVFYPDFIKIGFMLYRSELSEENQKRAAQKAQELQKPAK
jgi:hypothetical protein